ncbi:MAG TPA: hypothetical protein DDW23_04540 [Planctomycetes bacterium]|nr:hypothetical protein [Planctomycetota bacterium]
MTLKACPRRLVLELLLGEGLPPSRRFPVAADKFGLEGADRSLARQMLLGVLRHGITLDQVAQAYAKKRIRDPALCWTLRLGLYQLFYLDSVPDHAAVNETLGAARSLIRGKSGFANGVLRSAQRGSSLFRAGEAREAGFSLEGESRSWVFDRRIFPDAEADAVTHNARLHGFPDWLARKWFRDVGEAVSVGRMQALNKKSPLWLRVNPLRSDRTSIRRTLEAVGLEAQEGSHELSLVVTGNRGPIANLPGFSDGAWSVQDISALEATAQGLLAPGERMLDLCAAPGGKSFAAFELAGGEAEVVSCDISASRLASLEDDAKRLGHKIATCVLDSRYSNIPRGPWDLVLMDVPCTNTGVLDRRLEARHRLHKKSVHDACTIQNLIRKQALPLVQGPGTRILWSTCSLEPEENEEMVERLARKGNLEIVSQARFEPDNSRSGGYASLLAPAAQVREARE